MDFKSAIRTTVFALVFGAITVSNVSAAEKDAVDKSQYPLTV